MELQHVDKLFIAQKAFIVNNGKILLLQESLKYDEGSNPGRGDVPGGRVKPGEGFIEALDREILEETGLAVKRGQPFTMGEWRPQVKGEQWQIIATFVECFTDQDEVKLSLDHQAFKWIDPKSYKDHGPYAGFIEQAFQDYFKRWQGESLP
jgi:8-oxo-dGTP diphosphatase